jgi:hypothetical protein
MTKSEYIKNKQKIEDQIRDLRQKLKYLKSEYIEANRIFKDGEKVKVTNATNSKEKFAFVYGYTVDSFSNDLVPKIKRCKKDGTMSKVNDYLWLSDILSPIK